MFVIAYFGKHCLVYTQRSGNLGGSKQCYILGTYIACSARYTRNTNLGYRYT